MATVKKAQLLQDTVVRLDSHGLFHLMNRPESGWNCRSRIYPSLREITDRYDVRIGAQGQDDHSVFFHVHVNMEDQPPVWNAATQTVCLMIDNNRVMLERVLDGVRDGCFEDRSEFRGYVTRLFPSSYGFATGESPVYDVDVLHFSLNLVTQALATVDYDVLLRYYQGKLAELATV